MLCNWQYLVSPFAHKSQKSVLLICLANSSLWWEENHYQFLLTTRKLFLMLFSNWLREEFGLAHIFWMLFTSCATQRKNWWTRVKSSYSQICSERKTESSLTNSCSWNYLCGTRGIRRFWRSLFKTQNSIAFLKLRRKASSGSASLQAFPKKWMTSSNRSCRCQKSIQQPSWKSATFAQILHEIREWLNTKGEKWRWWSQLQSLSHSEQFCAKRFLGNCYAKSPYQCLVSSSRYRNQRSI